MRHAGVLAIVVVALAAVSLVQGGGSNQFAHYALVRALSHGTPVVDSYRSETGDLAEYKGHYYSAKAPGTALLAVGPYVVLDRSGLLGAMSRATGIERSDIDLWALAAIVSAFSAVVTLLLVMRLGNDVAAGFGAAAAVTLGVATLILPFSTLLFAHVPAAAFAFAAFAVLWLRRSRWAVFAAGILAGIAVTIEYPLGIAAVGLGLYACARGDVLRRALAYAAGFAIGAGPALLYNWWAFGSPLRFPYEYALPVAGQPANDQGFFGISWPSPGTAVDLLFGGRGLVVVTPVVLLGLAALVPLYRRGRRHEAILIGAITLAFLVYNAGYDVPFGGDAPGPRFLIPVLPFLAVPLARAYELWSWPTAALAVVSAVYAVGVTVTGPLDADGWDWVTTSTGGTPGELVRFLPLVTVAIILAALSARSHSRASSDTP